MNSTFRARWLASSEVISQVLFTSEQPKKNKMTFVGKLSQIKLLFGSLVIQLAWYIIKQLFTSVSVKVVYIYLAASRIGKYPPLYSPPLRWIIVKYFVLQKILTHVKRMVRSGPAFCNCSLNLNFKIVNLFFFFNTYENMQWMLACIAKDSHTRNDFYWKSGEDLSSYPENTTQRF